MTVSQRGVARPFWLATAILTCVVFGSTLNRCLTCGTPVQALAPFEEPPALVQGSLFDEPVKEIEDPEEKVDPPLPPPVKGTWLTLSWEKLGSYVYEFPEIDEDTELKDQIPASIKQLDGRKVALAGFMMPVELEGEEITEFLLVKSQLFCCFGQIPRMNEWIHVKMLPGTSAPFVADVPMTIFGTLEVGEVVEDGIVMSIYRIACEDVYEPPVFR